MNFSKLLSDLSGASGPSNGSTQGSAGDILKGITNKIPGGLAGGALAGGVVAMLVGSKSARKTATTAAKYGGAAVLGGLAYKAYKNWQSNSAEPAPQMAAGQSGHYAAAANHANAAPSLPNYEKEALEHINGAEHSDRVQLALVKAMIASARADGNIDADEQRKISEAINQMHLNQSAKSELLELFIKPIAFSDFVGDLKTMEQKAEGYLASCLVIELDHEGEYAHLSNLARALELPPGLEQQLRAQAHQATSVSA